MELYQLQYFKALCCYKSFTQTAKSFDVTQPSITIAIKKLEKELGGPLFDFVGKQFRLTPLGEILLQHVNVIDDEVSAIIEESRAITYQKQDPILVGIPLTLCPNLATRIMMDFGQKHPETTVLFYQNAAEIISEQLCHGLIDIGIVCENMLTPAFDYKLLESIEFFAFFPKESRLSNYDVISPELLNDELLIMSESPSGVMAHVSDYLKQNNVRMAKRLGNMVPENAYITSQNNNCVAFLSKEQYAKADASYAPLSPPLIINIYLAYRKPRIQAPHKKELVRFITNLYK